VLTLMNAALAAPLVHDGDPQAAIDAASRRGGVDPGMLEPISLQELRGRPPVLLAGGQAQGCLEGATPAPVPEALTRAEGALLYGRFDEAMSSVIQARQEVLCSGAPTPPGLLARIELLTGLIAQERGDEATARTRYLAALVYDPQIPWPQAYPAERRTLFDTARTELSSATTSLSVRPLQPPALLDGQAMPQAVLVGEHVVHVGSVAVHVVLDEAPNRLVVPPAFPPDALSWAGDDAHRAELSALLAATLGEGTDTWVVHGENVWHGIAGRTDWEAFLTLPDPVVPVPVEPTVPEQPRRWGVTLAGGGLALLGGVAGTAGTLWANGTARKAEGTWGSTYDGLHQTYRLGLITAGVGWGLVGVGAGVGGAGYVTGSPR
jgi:hypothetical protein